MRDSSGAVQGLDSFRLALNDLRLRPDLMTKERAHKLELTRQAYGGLDSVQRDVIVSGEAAFEEVTIMITKISL